MSKCVKCNIELTKEERKVLRGDFICAKCYDDDPYTNCTYKLPPRDDGRNFYTSVEFSNLFKFEMHEVRHHVNYNRVRIDYFGDRLLFWEDSINEFLNEYGQKYIPLHILKRYIVR